MWDVLCASIVAVIEAEYNKLLLVENATSSNDSLQPVSIDSYIIEDKIGDISTCATVYRALRDEQPVALKAMFNFTCENEEEMMSIDNFGAELMTGRLDFPPHPNVIKITNHFVGTNVPHSHSALTDYPAVFEWGHDKTLYLEMPLYTCSLSEHVTHHVLSESEVVWVLYQIVAAVYHIHSHNIVHRDIKMDNLLVRTREGVLEVVLTDFGMACDTLLPPKGLGRKWGNPMLMPPEVACAGERTPPDYTRADMWCVGSLVYELLGAPNPFSTLQSNKYDSLPDLPSNNPVLHGLVHQLLARDPQLRPSPRECLALCGAMLWLPKLLDPHQNITMEQASSQLALLSWQTYKSSRESGGPEVVGKMYFVKHTTGRELWRVVNNTLKHESIY